MLTNIAIQCILCIKEVFYGKNRTSWRAHYKRNEGSA